MDGDFFIGAALGTTLTKLALRYGIQATPEKRNKFDAEVMLVIAGIIHLGKSGIIHIFVHLQNLTIVF